MKTLAARLLAVFATLLLVCTPALAADQVLGYAHVDTTTGLVRFPGLAPFSPCATTTLSGILKGNGSTGCAVAIDGVDYVSPTYSQQRLSHVANNAALKAWTNYAYPVRRDGFATAGDGGEPPFPYYHTTTACSQADDGAQVTAADGNCWVTDVQTMPVSIKVWGAIDDSSTTATNNFTKIQAAINACQSPSTSYQQTCTLWVPHSKNCFNFGSTLTLPGSYVEIVGASMATSCLQTTFATGNGIQVGTGATYFGQTSNPFFVGVRNLMFDSTVTRTSGAYAYFLNSYHTTFENISCAGTYDTCVGVDGLGGQTAFNQAASGANDLDHWIRGVVNNGTARSIIALGCQAGGVATNVIIQQGEFGNAVTGAGGSNPGAAIELCDASGVLLSNNNFDENTHSIWAHPKSTGFQTVGALHVDNTNFLDYSSQEGVLLDASGGGLIEDNRFTQVWIATCGLNFSTAAYSGYACIKTVGPAANIVDNSFDVQILASGGHGIVDGGGTNTRWSGTIANGGFADPTGHSYSGLLISSTSTHVSWNGSIGGASGVSVANAYGYGVQFIGAVSGCSISGDLSGNYFAPLSHPEYCPQANYEGVLPQQFARGPLAGFRNLVINGNFAINQRGYGSGGSVAAAGFFFDHWYNPTSSAVAYTFTAPQQSETQTSSAIDTVLTVPANGYAAQKIEHFNNPGGPVTLSWSGTCTGTLNYYNGSTFTGLSTSITSPQTIASVPVGTTLQVQFTGGSSSCTLSDVQLEPGLTASPFERRPIATELALAQRYYFATPVTTVISRVYNTGASTSTVSINYSFPVQMRSVPTVTSTVDINDAAAITPSNTIATTSRDVIILNSIPAGASLDLDSLTASAEF